MGVDEIYRQMETKGGGVRRSSALDASPGNARSLHYIFTTGCTRVASLPRDIYTPIYIYGIEDVSATGPTIASGLNDSRKNNNSIRIELIFPKCVKKMILFLDRLINIPEFYNLIDKKNSILDETERMFIRNSSFISNSENKFRHFKQILVRGLSKSYNTCILFIYICNKKFKCR